MTAEVERWRAPARARRFDEHALLRATGQDDIASLWRTLSERPFLLAQAVDVREHLDALCPGDRGRIVAAAERALRREVNLLGSGPVALGTPIDWHADFKAGRRWPARYGRGLDLLELDRPSDVKVPWELSRLHWLIPAAQSYILTDDERCAVAVKDVLVEWMRSNPCPIGINWSISMEVALRILSWTFFFHTFKRSAAWADGEFRAEFLRSLYLHVDHTARNLEVSDINGNHLDADAAGLVFGGLFFGGPAGNRWGDQGWAILRREIGLQVSDDGVDFEGSTAYHRLVAELFLLPAIYRLRCGREVDQPYVDHLAGMARFVTAYSRPDGLAPLWGDGDDGRALPLGTQPLRDHRYLAGLVGALWPQTGLFDLASGPRGEILWMAGSASALRVAAQPLSAPRSQAFERSGIYVMRSDQDYVFVDAGPVGMHGRGGHGHNDCLSFDLVLAGVPLIADPGCFVYSASYEWRNRFRSTAFHNTPVVDGVEQNRFVDPRYLWSLQYDAVPVVTLWSTDASRDRLEAGHTGYARLETPVGLRRTIVLDRIRHRFVAHDVFESPGPHQLTVPLHFDPAVRLVPAGDREIQIVALRGFKILWSCEGNWTAERVSSWYSPSYGVRVPSEALEFRSSDAKAALTMVVAQAEDDTANALDWAVCVAARQES